jgi:membrane protein DedA with SNARE-associated domain
MSWDDKEKALFDNEQIKEAHRRSLEKWALLLLFVISAACIAIIILPASAALVGATWTVSDSTGAWAQTTLTGIAGALIGFLLKQPSSKGR